MNYPSDKKKNNLLRIIREFLQGKHTAEGEELFENWWNKPTGMTAAGELTEKENREISQRMLQRLKGNMKENDHGKPEGQARIIEFPTRGFSGEAVSRKNVFPGRIWMAAAAAVFILCIGAYLLHQVGHAADKRDWLVAVAKPGENRKVIMPDGTVVILHEGARLRYPKGYGNTKTRQADIEGEAFFDVAKDPAHPFMLSCGHAEVRVLGTRFNIIAGQPDSSVVIAMKDGRVAVRDDRMETIPAIYLTNGDVGIVGNEGKLTKEQGIADNENYFSWMDNGSLSFDGTPLVQVITQLKRIYGRRILLENPSMMNRKITLQYPGADLGTILQVIGKTMNADIIHTDDTTYLIK